MHRPRAWWCKHICPCFSLFKQKSENAGGWSLPSPVHWEIIIISPSWLILSHCVLVCVCELVEESWGPSCLHNIPACFSPSERPPTTLWSTSTDSPRESSMRGLGPKQTKKSWLVFPTYLWIGLFCSSLEMQLYSLPYLLLLNLLFIYYIYYIADCVRKRERIKIVLYSMHPTSRKIKWHCHFQPIKFWSFMHNSVMFYFCNCA